MYQEFQNELMHKSSSGARVTSSNTGHNIDIRMAINYMKRFTGRTLSQMTRAERQEYLKQYLIAKYGIQGYNEILKHESFQLEQARRELESFSNR